MKRTFTIVAAVLILVGCNGSTTVTDTVVVETKNDVEIEKKNVYELSVDIFNVATEKLKDAKSEADIEEIENGIESALAAVEGSEEMRVYMSYVEMNDTVALKEYEESRLMLIKAAEAYSSALSEAYMGLR